MYFCLNEIEIEILHIPKGQHHIVDAYFIYKEQIRSTDAMSTFAMASQLNMCTSFQNAALKTSKKSIVSELRLPTSLTFTRNTKSAIRHVAVAALGGGCDECHHFITTTYIHHFTYLTHTQDLEMRIARESGERKSLRSESFCHSSLHQLVRAASL